MTKIVIGLATIYIVYSVLLNFGVFERIDRPKKTVKEIESKRTLAKKRKFESFILGIFSGTCNVFRGFFMNDIIYKRHEYYIQRLELRTKNLGRLKTPEEIRGQYAFFLILGILCIPLGFFFPVFFVVTAFTAFMFATYQTQFKMRIADEDDIIESKFIDLYLLLYSKLRQGSRARLQGTVENYIATLEATRFNADTKVMLKFARHFLNLLALYEDHVAVPMLRDLYHSATVINFCNVATQSLNGVENFDNLLTFKMMLVDRKTVLMRKRQQAILHRGQMSIFAIWVILFIFIIVGWYSKLPTGFF